MIFLILYKFLNGIELIDQSYYPANDISRAAPLLAQKSWSLEGVLFTPGLIGSITENINDFLSTTPVLIGYI